jgi:hypothetical protein
MNPVREEGGGQSVARVASIFAVIETEFYWFRAVYSAA